VTEVSESPAYAGGIGYRVALDGFDHQQVHIAVRCWLAVGIGSEEDDLLGMELIGEHLEVWAQLVCDPVDRMAWIAKHILADSPGN
jgi:hypothetical protein